MILTKADKIKDFMMIELQGEIQYSENLDGLKLGKLEDGGQKCKLVIGNHILRGKAETLSKPIAVIQKSNQNLIMVGMIHKKLIFSERPAPIPDQTKKTMKQLIK